MVHHRETEFTEKSRMIHHEELEDHEAFWPSAKRRGGEKNRQNSDIIQHGSILRNRQEITWTFGCPIAPHLWPLLNRQILTVAHYPSAWLNRRDQIYGTLEPQNVQFISCRSLNPRAAAASTSEPYRPTNTGNVPKGISRNIEYRLTNSDS